MKNEVFIGLTYGDPASIGPEILLNTLKNWKFKFKPIVIGSKDFLIRKKSKNKIKAGFYPVNDKQAKNLNYISGRPSKYTGIHAYRCLEKAIALAKEKKIIALVTGPVSKKAINLAHISFSGQTDEIAKKCKVNCDSVIMLFVAQDLRISLFTRHIPLKRVCSEITQAKLEQYLLLLNRELKKWFRIKDPRIGVLGLNPHASENGLFGNEEKTIITPVIKKLSSIGIKVFGPLSPDATLAQAGRNFLSGKKQSYDVYVSFYHDQSLPMFKAVSGMKGVNVTLGLPFLRASVEHGTAFDIAGKNKASNEGLVSAIKLVEELLA